MLYRNKDSESVLCKNFSEKFYDLVKINGYISNHNCISDFIDYLYEFSNFPSTIDCVVRDDKHHEIFCTFDMCGFRYFRIEITFQKDSYVRFVVYRSYDEPAVDVTMKFNVRGFESLFNFSVSQVFHTNGENASEPEQPAEDAEEQDNPEQTPAEEKVQSTLKYVLSCNKTKLYNLVKAKSPFDLPKLRDTYYEHSKGMHWFTYTSKNSRYVKCSFGSSYGAFLLRVEAFEYDEVFELSFEDLLSFDLVKEVHEKNISEPEQPVEDAEEQENPEQTPAEDAEEQENPEQTPAEENIFEPLEDEPVEDITLDIKSLTPLEIAFFEQVYGNECDLEDETIDHEFDAYLAEFVYGEIMKKSKSFDMYWLWRDERKRQEVVGASK